MYRKSAGQHSALEQGLQLWPLHTHLLPIDSLPHLAPTSTLALLALALVLRAGLKCQKTFPTLSLLVRSLPGWPDLCEYQQWGL